MQITRKHGSRLYLSTDRRLPCVNCSFFNPALRYFVKNVLILHRKHSSCSLFTVW